MTSSCVGARAWVGSGAFPAWVAARRREKQAGRRTTTGQGELIALEASVARQPIVRVGYWDNDLDHSASDAALKNQIERTDLEVGANWYFRSHEAKLQVSYDRQQFKNPDGMTTRQPVNEVILAGQIWF